MTDHGRACGCDRIGSGVAKQAENGAFSPEEVSGALEAALLKEAVPLKEVCRAVVPSDQGVLFRPDLGGEFGALWRDHTGSKVVQALLTCLRDQEANGSSGREMVESAVADALDECARDHSRAMVEHYYRKSRSPTVPRPTSPRLRPPPVRFPGLGIPDGCTLWFLCLVPRPC